MASKTHPFAGTDAANDTTDTNKPPPAITHYPTIAADGITPAFAPPRKKTARMQGQRRILFLILQIDRLNNRLILFIKASLFGFIFFALLFEPSLIALLIAFAVLFATTGAASLLMALFLFAVCIAATTIFACERCNSTAHQAQ